MILFIVLSHGLKLNDETDGFLKGWKWVPFMRPALAIFRRCRKKFISLKLQGASAQPDAIFLDAQSRLP